MFGKKLIAVLALSIFCFCALLALGKHVNLPAAGIERSEGPAFGTLNLASIVFAQNDNTAPDDSEKSKSESEAKGSEAESERVDEEKKSSKEASKPLKPFVPSEKIPGEQAVDFPVDI